MSNPEPNKNISSDKSKTSYKISNNPYISQITIYKTKNSPKTLCYLTSNYSKTLNSLICIGGTDTKCNQSSIPNIYNLETNTWNSPNNFINYFDTKISGHTSNLITLNNKEKIFIFGGYNDILKEFSDQSYLINPIDMSYQEINYNFFEDHKKRLPKARTYHTANYDPEKQLIYIYGGTDMNINNSKEENFRSVWIFHIEGFFWEQFSINQNSENNINQILGAPRGHSTILYENKLFIFGGVFSFKKFSNILYLIDLENHEIHIVNYKNNKNSALPNPTAFHSCAKIDENKFLIYGGLDSNYNTINDCYIYYFNDEKFEKVIIPLLPKLFGHKMVKCYEKEEIFVVGGMDSFKYVGDESLIYSLDKEGEEFFDKSEKIEFKAMENILEINLKGVEKKEEKNKVGLNENKKDVNKDKKMKKVRWKKLFI